MNKLAVYAVKTIIDMDSEQEVIIMDKKKKQLLREVFWKMNQSSHSVSVQVYKVSSTTTDARNIVETIETEMEVTLHIPISHKTAGEMANSYRFSNSQKEQLDFLLSPENHSLWDALLRETGISAGDGGNGGDLASVVLSQVRNVGGQPYWRWYGFNSRVEWWTCFIFWCANKSDCFGTAVPKFSRCVDGVAWLKSQRRLESDSIYRDRETLSFSIGTTVADKTEYQTM